MFDFLLKILAGIINALNEVFAVFNYDEKQVKRTERPASVSQPPAPSPTAPTQTEKPPVNVLVPVEVTPEPPQYKRGPSVLTYQERRFLTAIRKAVGNEYIILMKVRMGDFIYIANQPKDGAFYPNQVMYKHADFLLCGKLRIEPLLVIELDDKSHLTPKSMESDKIKNETCDAVGLPYLRIELQKTYDPDQLRAHIKEKILPEAPLFTSN